MGAFVWVAMCNRWQGSVLCLQYQRESARRCFNVFMHVCVCISEYTFIAFIRYESSSKKNDKKSNVFWGMKRAKGKEERCKIVRKKKVKNSDARWNIDATFYAGLEKALFFVARPKFVPSQLEIYRPIGEQNKFFPFNLEFSGLS